MTGPFNKDELPTTPTRKEHEAARLVRLWNASSDKDQKRVMKLLERCALSNQGAVDWQEPKTVPANDVPKSAGKKIVAKKTLAANVAGLAKLVGSR